MTNLNSQKTPLIKRLFNKNNFSQFIATIICIILGILIGFIILVATNPSASINVGLAGIFMGGAEEIGKVFYLSAPIIMTGLSVAFANKVGLFNIGAPGQFIVGGLAAIYFAVTFQLNWALCLLIAAVCGFIYGLIPGFLKANFNVNEVISTIMLNWIALFLGNVFVLNVPGLFDFKQYKTTVIPTTSPSSLPRFGDSSYANIGIFVGIFFAIILFIVLKKTTFGYEMTASGFNRDASTYAGISTKRNIVLAMGIAGALSAIGGALYYLVGGSGPRYQPQRIAVPEQGFNGIPVAILANNNPIACVAVALFISYIQVGADFMQPEYASEVVDLVIAIIIYLSAFNLVIKNLIEQKDILLSFKAFFTRKKKKEKVKAVEDETRKVE